MVLGHSLVSYFMSVYMNLFNWFEWVRKAFRTVCHKAIRDAFAAQRGVLRKVIRKVVFRNARKGRRDGRPDFRGEGSLPWIFIEFRALSMARLYMYIYI